MFSRLSMSNLLAALIFWTAVVTGAEMGVIAIRQPGASLDTSMQNEVDHAVRQAAAWLAAHQNTDGAWGVTNRVRLTSIILLSLNASRQPGYSEVTTRAALWLDAHAADRVEDLETHAWRLIGLSRVAPDSPARTHLLQGLSDAAKPLELNAPVDAARFWNEAQAAAGVGTLLPPSSDATNRLATLASEWPSAFSGNANAWQIARLVNRTGNGQLLHDNLPLDWRRDLAQRLINTQRSAPSNGGYWEAPDPESRLCETAFGLLTLIEL